MKLTYRLNDAVTFEIENDKHKAIFGELASAIEAFGQEQCANCQSRDLKFIHRIVDDNDFYEMRCGGAGCYSTLAMGQHKKNGTLFPRRRDEEGKEIGKQGWKKWEKPSA